MLASCLRRSSGESGEWSCILLQLNPETGARVAAAVPAFDESLQAPRRLTASSTPRFRSWSPRLPLLSVKPRPLIRSTFPELLPLGIVIITGPSGVGTFTLAPVTASLSVTGRSIRMSLPSRR